jgi:CHAT domain-containing protein/tetratricopeptide (TPR) repeat protein
MLQDLREARMLNNIGRVYDDLGEKQKALEHYSQALPLWEIIGDRIGESTTLNNIGAIYYDLGEKQKALEYLRKSLSLSQAVGDRTGEDRALHNIGNIGNIANDFGKKQKALASSAEAILDEGVRLYQQQTLESLQQAIAKFQEALQLFRTNKDLAGEAKTLNNIGFAYDALGEKQKALKYYEEALPLRRATGDLNGEANTLNNIGFIYSDLGEKRKALEYYEKALSLRRAANNLLEEANTLNNIGGIYDAIWEKEKALEYFRKALSLHQSIKNSAGEANVLNNIGFVYAVLGEKNQALEYYEKALPLSRAAGDFTGAAYILNNIGLVYHALGQKEKALEYYEKALPLSRAAHDRAGEATTLNSIGIILNALGQKEKALEYYEKALPLSRATGDKIGEATTLNNIGVAFDAPRELEKAHEYFNQAILLTQTVGDSAGEATTIANIARLYSNLGKIRSALEKINSAITIIEKLRTKIGSQDLRASYFASVQDYYQFKINLLMQLHLKSPEEGYDKQALETADRGRARSLIELLAEAGVTLQPTTESAPLIPQERQLQQSLRQVEQQRVILLSKDHTPDQVATLDQQSDTLVAQLQDLTTRLRATNPVYANLKYPLPLTLAQIQQQVVDTDTVLLQYALGEDRSYLWAVTPNGIKSYILPKKSILEAAVKPFQSALSTPGTLTTDVKRTGDALYQLILAPVAAQFQGKRLLIVADGLLQTIPFSAIPLPNTETYTPLLKKHEIINAPSASAVAIQRQQQHPIGTKTLAVLADPVFRNDDGRVAERNTALDTCAPALVDRITPTNTIAQTLPVDLQRSLRDLDLRGIQRLPNTRLEATQILSLVPPDQRSVACAFAASYGRVTQSQQDPLSQYRIVHFATHGFINNERPQFSGLVLSLVDAKGQPKDGFLRLRDIFNLKLAADLVVLSACQTGVGKDIKGEGIIGLTRGFMYAGSKRIVASLWNVDDAATAQLMGNFYRGMLKDKQTPAVALRNAQLQAWQANPDPRLWAAFTFQGEWRP